MFNYEELVLNNEVLGPEYRRGLVEGNLEGEREPVRRLIQKRFSPIPEWALDPLASQSSADLEALGLGVLDAKSFEELLR